MDSKPVSDCLPSHQKENRFDEIQKRLKDGTNNVKSFLSKTIINSMRSCDAKDMTVEQHEMTFTPATPNKGNGSIRPIAVSSGILLSHSSSTTESSSMAM